MNVHFKTIYCVSLDWANKYESHNEIKACFEDKGTAIAYMNTLWESEREDTDGFEKYDMIEETNEHKEAWIDGEWLDSHICMEILETRLYK